MSWDAPIAVRRAIGIWVLVVGCGTHAAPSDAGSDASAACLIAPCGCPSPGSHVGVASTDGTGPRTVDVRVPGSLRCDGHGALIVLLATADDGFGAEIDALADRDGVIVARPVPLSPTAPWLAADGSIDPRELDFVAEIVDALSTTAPTRRHVIGIGSGAAVAASVLGDPRITVSGIGLVAYAGDAPTVHAGAGTRPRVWAATGYRAHGIDAQQALFAQLAVAGFGPSELLLRQLDSGDASPAWLADEAWAWLDASTWPENGPPALPWRRVRFPWIDASLLASTARADGTLVAGAADGRVFATDDSGKWGPYATLGEGPLTSAITRASGEVRLGSTEAIATSVAPDTFARTHIPIDGSLVSLIERHDGTWIGASPTIGLATSADGVAWSRLSSPLTSGAALAMSPITHTVLAVGRGSTIARSVEGSTTIDAIVAQTGVTRFDDVAAGLDGSFWIAGAGGALLRSTDDGRAFLPVIDATGSSVDDLYCVAVGADGSAIAGGAHGTVVVSHDGHTLRSWPTGGEGFVGDVRWTAPGSALLLGQDGMVLVGDGL